MNHCVQLVKQMDWNNLRAFLAVVRGGTLRVAAERTDLSAATVSRRLDELETVVGEKLIGRADGGDCCSD
jgi:DNA-binding transcriptional LysR family regulator